MLNLFSAFAPLAKAVPAISKAAGGMLAGAGPVAAQPGGMLALNAPVSAAPAASAIAAAAPPVAAGGGGAGGFLSNIISPSTGRQLIDMGSAMMQSAAPSTDPRSGDFFNALGAGGAAFSQSGRQAQDDAVKAAYTNAMIGNTNASATSSLASADATRAAIAREEEMQGLRQQFFTNGQAQLAQPGQVISANPVPPDAAIADLQANPALAGDFDAFYGPGSSARILGVR